MKTPAVVQIETLPDDGHSVFLGEFSSLGDTLE